MIKQQAHAASGPDRGCSRRECPGPRPEAFLDRFVFRRDRRPAYFGCVGSVLCL
jgi:hypothetical protein